MKKRARGSQDDPVELSDSDDAPPPRTGAASSSAGAASSSADAVDLTDDDSPLVKLTAPLGLLDPRICKRVDAIAGQNNCLGCGGKGLAAAMAAFGPAGHGGYGCPYRGRTRLPGGRGECVPEDRPVPGTADVRRPPAGASELYPAVLCLYSQWAKGKPWAKGQGYHKDIPPPAAACIPGGKPCDSEDQREVWFGACLRQLSKQLPEHGLHSVAFPYFIGCGLAGGHWPNYERMLLDFAKANRGSGPQHDGRIEVIIAARPDDLQAWDVAGFADA